MRLMQLAVACLAMMFATAATSYAGLITNGNFETGSFAGWTVGTTQADPFEAALNDGQNSERISAGAGGYSWFVRNKNANYFGSPDVATPITNFSAFNGFDGSPGYFYLRQGFSLSADPVVSANLAFDYAVQSNYSGESRVFTANILDATGTTQLANLFSYTRPTGYLAAWSPANVNLDIASVLNGLGSGDYQLEFRIDIPQSFTGPAQFAIDNIELNAEQAATVPEPSSLVIFGLGACIAGVGGAWRRRRANKPQAAA
jgi:hypothetical protein